MKYTIEDIISKIDTFEENAIVFAKKVNGAWQKDSEAVVFELTEEEHGIPTTEYASQKCPGFDYFLEVFLIKEMLEDLSTNNRLVLKNKVEQIIQYAENDA